MILDNPESHFIFLFHPRTIYLKKRYTVYNGKELTNAEVMKYWGKWLVLGDRDELNSLAEKLDPYVNEKKIPCIKYDRKSSTNLAMEECVMMVYCDFRQREDVWAILKEHGVKIKAWVTEKETMDLWRPGAPLLERWLESTGFDEETKEAARNDAGARLSHIENNPDELFNPWEQ